MQCQVALDDGAVSRGSLLQPEELGIDLAAHGCKSWVCGLVDCAPVVIQKNDVRRAGNAPEGLVGVEMRMPFPNGVRRVVRVKGTVGVSGIVEVDMAWLGPGWARLP